MSLKRENNAIRLLRLWSDGKLHSTWSCTKVAGTRFGARFQELRDTYHINVEKKYIGEDSWCYAWLDDEATKRRVLEDVIAGRVPPKVESRQLTLV